MFCSLPFFKFVQENAPPYPLSQYKHWQWKFLDPVLVGKGMPSITLTFQFVKAAIQETRHWASVQVFWEAGIKVDCDKLEIDGVMHLWRINGRENGSGLGRTFGLQCRSDTHEEREGGKEDWVGGDTCFISVLRNLGEADGDPQSEESCPGQEWLGSRTPSVFITGCEQPGEKASVTSDL